MVLLPSSVIVRIAVSGFVKFAMSPAFFGKFGLLDHFAPSPQLPSPSTIQLAVNAPVEIERVRKFPDDANAYCSPGCGLRTCGFAVLAVVQVLSKPLP